MLLLLKYIFLYYLILEICLKKHFHNRISSSLQYNLNGSLSEMIIIVQDKKLNPIEVKSGNYKKHTSIDRFKDKFKKSVGTRYVLHTKDLKVEGDIVYLPLYMAIFL